MEFTYKNVSFKANVVGRHYLENLIAAIVTAESIGMDLEEIARAVGKIEPSKFMIRTKKGIKGAVFIDDTYNANSSGVIAALEYLDEACKNYRRVVVFSGIIELGCMSKDIHKELYGRIGKVCETAYITRKAGIDSNLDFENIAKENEAVNGNVCSFVFEDDFDKIAAMIRKRIDGKTAILFEGRKAGVVMKKLEH